MIHMAVYVCGLCECMRTCGRAHVASGHSPHSCLYRVSMETCITPL